MGESPERKTRRPPGLIVEEVLIFVSVGLLFVLTVFFRRELWGKCALIGVLVVMLIVFVRRLSRTHRAFRGGKQ